MSDYSVENFGKSSNNPKDKSGSDYWIRKESLKGVSKRYFGEDGKLKEEYVVVIDGKKYPVVPDKRKISNPWNKNGNNGKPIKNRYGDNGKSSKKNIKASQEQKQN